MQLEKQGDFKTKVICLIGPPGIGKNQLANKIATEVYNNAYYKPRGDCWNGYSEETDCVVIDDFYGWIK